MPFDRAATHPGAGVATRSPRPAGPAGLATTVLIELRRGPDVATDVVLRCGCVGVTTEPVPGGRAVRADFHNTGDAARAAVEVMRAVPEAERTGVRMAVCTVEADRPGEPGGFDRASAGAVPLLLMAGPGRILVAARTAVVSGPSLPRGVELVDHGVWTPVPGGPPERSYEIRIGGPDVRDIPSARTAPGPSNLGWARRATHGVLPADKERHLATVGAAWRDALAGRGRTILFSGGAGAERHGVVGEAALWLHAQGAQVLYGQWTDRAGDVFGPFREALGVHADGCSNEQLVHDLEGWADEVTEMLPEVGARLAGARRGRPVAGSNGYRLFDAAEAWVRAIAARAPALLVLSDIQRADPCSVQLLAHVQRVCRQGRLLVLVTGEGIDADLLDQLDRGGPGTLRHVPLG